VLRQRTNWWPQERKVAFTSSDLSGDRASVCSCNDLSLDFGRTRVLSGCNLTVEPGTIVGLTGENGSGKSSLIKCLLGFFKPTSGLITRHPRTGYCPQENYLHRSYTVDEHLAFVASLRPREGLIDEEFRQRCIETLKLDRHLGYSIRKLSGGTYQKVKFMTAILHRPALLILDEPTDGFDWAMYLVFWDILGQLVRFGTGVLMISHLLHDRERFDRILELREGKLHEAA
jgi:ABC-2 type transport system ATP-binding protein